MWSLSLYDAEHPSSAVKAAVSANVLAPPSLTLQQVLELQEAEIAAYSKPDFQTLSRSLVGFASALVKHFARPDVRNELYAALEAASPEQKAHVRQQLCSLAEW
ncbi:NaCP60E [Symbiodinium natans]|uniref:NaCP60E protein n=1 Tax=Symbiodinium natans TaxID=878477 RepID=A0A812GZJ4_9DINO|nr:NaCP60E [Symbiodinium natans]